MFGSLNIADSYDLLGIVVEQLRRLGAKPQEIERFVRLRQYAVPAGLFGTDLAVLEVLALFLKDVHNLRHTDIAELLGRDERTVWSSYQRAKKKNVSVTDTDGRIRVPLTVFVDTPLSLTEALVVHLKEDEGISLKDIAQLLNKSQSTINVLHARQRRKQ